MVAVLNDFPYVFRIPRYLFFTYILPFWISAQPNHLFYKLFFTF